MSRVPPRPVRAVAGPRAAMRLDSWKEIATYLDTSVRTVQRWEKMEGLPVHRHEHLSFGTVYAFTNEIDTWLEGRSNGTDPIAAAPPAGTSGRHLWMYLAAGAVVLALAGSLVWRSRRPVPATQKQAIAVLYFANLSRDPALDWLNRGLCEMLTTNLSQIRGLYVLSTERTAAVLRRLGKAEVDAAVAPEVARNAGATAFVTGTLLRTGEGRLRLDLRAQDSTSGKVLLSERMEGENADAVFKIVDAMTANIAERFLPPGEAGGQAPNIAEVTTSNMEAFRHYQLGLEAERRLEPKLPLHELEEVVHLDPQFALAWLEMAKHYSRFGPRRRSYEILKELESNLSRLPRRSQLAVPALRAWAADDIDGVRRTGEALLSQFPHESDARIRLSAAHMRHDRFDLATEVVREGLKLDPNDPFLWSQLSYCLAGTGNLAAGLEANDRSRILLPQEPFPWLCRAELLFMGERADEAVAMAHESLGMGDLQAAGAWLDLTFMHADQQQFALAEAALREYRTQTNDGLLPFFEAELDEARGRLEAARQHYRQAITALAATSPDNAGRALLALAHLSDVMGDSAAALNFARRQRFQGEEHLAISFLEALQGDTGAAERSIERFRFACPWSTPGAVEIWRVRNHMAAALQRGEANAVRAYQQPLPVAMECWVPLYQARSALMVKDYKAAEHLLQRTLFLQRWLLVVGGMSHRRSPLLSLLCRFHLGQVYEATGRHVEAAAQYRRFLSAFEGSGTRLPQLDEARLALQRLGAAVTTASRQKPRNQ